MTSLQTQTSFGSHYGYGREDSKSRTKSTVKPVLKKLRQPSRNSSDKKVSLDLDRSWDEQAANVAGYGPLESSNFQYGEKEDISRGNGLSFGRFGANSVSKKDGRRADFSLDAISGHGSTRNSTKAARDVSFSLSPTDLSGDGSEIMQGGSMRKGGGWNSGRNRRGTGTFSGGSSRSASVATTATATTTSASANGTITSIASSKYPPSAQSYFSSFSGSEAQSHDRSASAASHHSNTTTGSGHKGSFVHPSKQVPRTSTLPLSYTNSLTSLEQAAAGRDVARDYASSVQKDSLDEEAVSEFDVTTTNTTASYRNSLSDVNSRPALSRQHTSSSDQGNTIGRSTLGLTSRPQFTQPRKQSLNGSEEVADSSGLATATATTTGGRQWADGSFPPAIITSTFAHANPITSAASATTPNALTSFSSSSAELETPLSALTSISTSGVTPPLGASHTNHSKGHHHHNRHSRTNSQSGTCNSVSSATSPLRTSLDMAGFRLRSRSEVDTAQRQEQIRAARVKFDEKEKAKDEEHFRRQQRKKEKAEEKAAARALGTDRHSGPGRRSATFGARGSASLDQRRPSAPIRAATFSSARSEKMADGDGAAYSTRQAEDVQFQAAPKRRTGAGSWTNFVLWFRVKIFRLGKK